MNTLKERRPYYFDFGKQPPVFEIQIGYALIPLLYEEKGAPLLKELEYGRKKFDAEYGLTLPSAYIRDNMCLAPDEYAIYFNGVEVGKWKVKRGYTLCIDTGDVAKKLDEKFDKVKEPAFGMEAFFIPDDEKKKYKDAGYACVAPERVIKTHLYQIAYKNRAKILNQCMVNQLVNKVRPTNPDVIDDVFFTRGFTTSQMKIVLNALLEEDVSIRDMNTILETIADYIEGGPGLFQLVDHIRERMAFSILSKYADENKKVHAIFASKNFAEHLWQYICIPSSKPEMPYFALEPEENKKIRNKISEYALRMAEKGFTPLFLVPNDLRLAFANLLKSECPDCRAISGKEAENFSFEIEGELDWDEN